MLKTVKLTHLLTGRNKLRKPNEQLATKIKETFLELMKEKEPSKIGMRELASKCGITAANIYHYYKNKEELMNAIGIKDSSQNQNSSAEKDTKNKRTQMKDVSKLIGFRPSIKVVDATLRDGGLVNNFFFPEGFEKALYEANVKAGVDYMEFGYRADKTMFKEDEFGPCKFARDDFIRSIVGDNNTNLKIAVMADVGRTNIKEDILPKSESPVDLIRVATYLHQIPGAIEMIEDAHNKGYETSCNIMAISTGKESDIKAALDIVGQSPVDVIYIVDSYGSIYPEEMARVADLYGEFAAKYNKKLGIHAHNNQQLAFANTIEAAGDGVDFLDATYAEMGRGAGNCAMELLIGFLKNPKYNIYPVLDFIEKYMQPMKDAGTKWGYAEQYMLTGLFNQHPRTAIAYTGANRKDITEYYKELTAQE